MVNKGTEDISELYKNKSSLSDAILGRVRTDKADNYYENLQTKVSNQLSNNKTITVSILKPISPGLDKEKFINLLQNNIYSELDKMN